MKTEAAIPLALLFSLSACTSDPLPNNDGVVDEIDSSMTSALDMPAPDFAREMEDTTEMPKFDDGPDIDPHSQDMTPALEDMGPISDLGGRDSGWVDMVPTKPPQCDDYQTAHGPALLQVISLDEQGMFTDQTPISEPDQDGMRRFGGELLSREPLESGGRLYATFTFAADEGATHVPGLWVSFYDELDTPIPSLVVGERHVYEAHHETMSGCSLNEGDLSQIEEFQVIRNSAGTPVYVQGLLAARDGGSLSAPAGFPFGIERFSWETNPDCKDAPLRNDHRRADILILDDLGLQRLGWGESRVTLSGFDYSVHISHATGFSSARNYCGVAYLTMVLAS